MNVHEEIVREYFKICKKCFMLENIQYMKITQRPDKKEGRNLSDIDLLAYSPEENVILDIEVKYRKNASGKNTKDGKKAQDIAIENFNNEQRLEKIKEYNPNGLNVKKTLVLTYATIRKGKREDYDKKFLEQNINVIYFETIIDELQMHYKKTQKASTSSIGQILKLIHSAFTLDANHHLLSDPHNDSGR